ncbi:MAG: site-2 protease family protein [Cocleimonas sp.]|nr:site-2 protease family protein [Cocleimonas sp.]
MYIDQRHRDKETTSKGEKIFILIISLAFLFMMTMEIMSNYEPKKLGALLFVIFWVPLLFIHEFGHAIMAKSLGWRVNRIVIGFGKVLIHTRLLGAPMEIRSIPLEGFVQIAPKTVTLARLKHALIYFAGPGIELLAFFIIMIMLGGFDQMFIVTNDYARIALQSFAFAALAGAVLNLIPLGITTAEGSTPNDGMGILLCLFASGMDYEMWIKESEGKEKEF